MCAAVTTNFDENNNFDEKNFFTTDKNRLNIVSANLPLFEGTGIKSCF